MNRLPVLGAHLLVSVCLSVFAVLVPLREVNASHLVNPQWPPHARLHEAWQLLANAALALLAIVSTWKPCHFLRACLIGMLLSRSFVLALGARSLYGGSLGAAMTANAQVLGIDLAVAVMIFTLCVFAPNWLQSWHATSAPSDLPQDGTP